MIFKSKFEKEGVLLIRPDEQMAWNLAETRHPWSWDRKQGAARRSSNMTSREAEIEVEKKIIPLIKVYRNVEYNF